MFCCVVKIVYIFITIFFCCCSSLFYFLYALFFLFFDWEERAHFYGKPLMMSSKDNENVRVQWRMRTHAQPEERRASSTNASVELENMPVLWPANASGGEGTQREQLARVFISAFWSIHPALPLYSTTLSLPCLVSTWLCSSALNPPGRRQKPAYMNNLFFFFFG